MLRRSTSSELADIKSQPPRVTPLAWREEPIRSSMTGNATPATQPRTSLATSTRMQSRLFTAISKRRNRWNRQADALCSWGAPLIEHSIRWTALEPLHTSPHCLNVFGHNSHSTSHLPLILFSASAASPVSPLIDSRNQHSTISTPRHKIASATAGCPPALLQE